jgi:hypothetical protein
VVSERAVSMSARESDGDELLNITSEGAMSSSLSSIRMFSDDTLNSNNNISLDVPTSGASGPCSGLVESRPSSSGEKCEYYVCLHLHFYVYLIIIFPNHNLWCRICCCSNDC